MPYYKLFSVESADTTVHDHYNYKVCFFWLRSHRAVWTKKNEMMATEISKNRDVSLNRFAEFSGLCRLLHIRYSHIICSKCNRGKFWSSSALQKDQDKDNLLPNFASALGGFVHMGGCCRLLPKALLFQLPKTFSYSLFTCNSTWRNCTVYWLLSAGLEDLVLPASSGSDQYDSTACGCNECYCFFLTLF